MLLFDISSAASLHHHSHHLECITDGTAGRGGVYFKRFLHPLSLLHFLHTDLYTELLRFILIDLSLHDDISLLLLCC